MLWPEPMGWLQQLGFCKTLVLFCFRIFELTKTQKQICQVEVHLISSCCCAPCLTCQKQVRNRRAALLNLAGRPSQPKVCSEARSVAAEAGASPVHMRCLNNAIM